MRSTAGAACVVLLGWCLAVAQHPRTTQPVTLKDLVGPQDPLALHDLRFDASFASLALDYLRSGEAGVLKRLADSPAAAHLLQHARNFDYDVPKDSAEALVSYLLSPYNDQKQSIEACKQSLALFSGPMLDDPHWVNDSLRYLPDDSRFRGALFLIFGYDIGVAFDSAASLNCAHPHFEKQRRELVYYAIHELHHVGFMHYQPPPKLSDLKTCGDLLRLVEYSTQLEGMAVLAAYQRRKEEHALSDDNDYVALQDEERMQRDEALYFEDFHYLEKRSAEPADAAAWAVSHRMSSGERLWYRVGARMAQRIEQASGRPALVLLIKQGPAAFIEAYQVVRRHATEQQLPPTIR